MAGIWMDKEERQAWASRSAAKQVEGPGARPGPAAGVKASEPKKRSPAKLALALLNAAEFGDAKEAMLALDEGAFINCRARTSPGYTPFILAITRGHDDLAVRLLTLGGWPLPDNATLDQDASARFNEGAKDGSFSATELAQLRARAIGLLARHAKSWSAMAAGRDACGAAKEWPDEKVLGLCFRRARFDLGLQAAKAGVEVSESCWDGSAAHGCWDFAGRAHRGELLGLLATPAFCARMTVGMCESLFSSAVRLDDLELFGALLDAGLRPSADWTIPKLRYFQPGIQPAKLRSGLLVLAAERERPSLLQAVKACAPAVEAAKRHPEPALSLATLGISRLLELRDLGVRLDVVDEEGLGIAHLWARADSEPRDGWASLARKAPEVFDLRDRSGQTGAEAMTKKLQGAAKDSFLASLSRIEVREITRELGNSTKAATPAARKRL